jgi:hypothetical protein
MKLLNQYFEIQKKIHEYFGYVEDWVVIPLEDRREYFWHLTPNEVYYAKSIIDFNEEIGNYYSNEIYTQRFLPKWVYRAEDYTMICVDTNTDGNKFLAIYSNEKELQENPLIEQ